MTMTTISSTAGQPASRNLPAGLFRVLGSLVNGIVTYFAHREAIKTLSELDDRALRDIGIERSQNRIGRSWHRRSGVRAHQVKRPAPAIVFSRKRLPGFDPGRMRSPDRQCRTTSTEHLA